MSCDSDVMSPAVPCELVFNHNWLQSSRSQVDVHLKYVSQAPSGTQRNVQIPHWRFSSNMLRCRCRVQRQKIAKNECGSKVCDMFPHFFVTSRSRTRKRTISNWQFIRWIYDVGPNFRFLAGLANKQTHTHIPKKNPCLLVRSSTNSCKAAVPLRSVALSLCTNSCPLAAWLGPQSRIFLGRSRHMFITCWKLGNHLVKRQAMRGYRLLSYRYLGLVWLNGMKKRNQVVTVISNHIVSTM